MQLSGYTHLLRRNQDYRRMWLGAVVSFAGDWFNTIALYTAVHELIPSGIAFAGVMVAKTLPAFLATPLNGILADTYDRRRLMIITDLTRALCALGLIWAYAEASPAALYGLTIIMVVCSGLSFACKSAAVPMIVEADAVVTANALNGGTFSAMLAIGAALGGVATSLFGVKVAFAIDAASFIVAMMLHSALPELLPSRSRARPARFSESLSYLRRVPEILTYTMLKPIIGLYGSVYVLIPVFGTSVFPEHSGPLFIGLLYTARGSGAVIGSILLSRLFGDSPAILRAVVQGALILIAVALAGIGYSDTLWSVAFFYGLAAIASSSIWVCSGSLIHLRASTEHHGRLFALDFGVMTLSMAITSALGGYALDDGYTNAQIAFTTAALAAVLAAVWACGQWVIKPKENATESVSH